MKALANTIPFLMAVPLSLSFSAKAAADQLAFLDLFEMSLQDLSKVRVSTVSKRSESALESPGITTVITAAEIKTFGATNIKDVLLRIPNLYIFDSSTFSSSGVSLRAGATQHLNNHVLYLIDGRPLRESQNGGLHTDINLLLPVDSIDCIEVVRGPGSVLYGTNAFSGTINFITRGTPNKKEATVRLLAGSDGYQRGGLSLQMPLGNEGGVRLQLNDLSSDGETIRAFDESATTGSLDLERDGQSFSLDAGYGGFSFMSMVNEITTPFVSGAFRWSNMAELELKREFYDLGYQHKFNDQWRLDVNYTYNQLDRFITGPGTGASEFKSSGYLYEVTFNGEFDSGTSVLIGGVVDQLKGDLGSRGGSYDNQRTGLYGQVNYLLNSKSKLLLGAQWKDSEDGEDQLSPRLGYTHRWNSNWSGKFLYSEAYRSPYGSELYFDAVFLQGAPSLKPEIISTLEGQLSYTVADYYIALTYYRSETEDSIGRAIVNGRNTFVNEDSKITFDGLEVEGKWSVTDSLQVQGSYHYQVNEDDNGQDDFMPAARTMTKLGLAYKFSRTFEFGLWASYFGKASKLENLDGNSTVVVNPDADAFTLLSLNVRANAGKLFNNDSFKNVELSVYGNNLLNEDVYFPELGRRVVNTYPQSHGQGIFAQVDVSF
ncbi:MAG: TonB-dependent receptor [Cellvibrionaceae bacterium]